MQAGFDGIDAGIRRGCSGCDADAARVCEPLRLQIVFGLDLMNPSAKAAAGLNQFARVVAVRAADHDHDIAFLRKFDRGLLTLFRRLANGIHKTQF